MTLEEYITKASEMTGGQKMLSRYINVVPNNISDAKMQRRGLPAAACVKLAKLINVNPLAVIAASELTTEKKEEDRALWREILRNHGKTIIATAITGAMILTLHDGAHTETQRFENAPRSMSCGTHKFGYSVRDAGAGGSNPLSPTKTIGFKKILEIPAERISRKSRCYRGFVGCLLSDPT
jgi:DNA-binding transcriptional regulator YdaS (Cro superfamily)